MCRIVRPGDSDYDSVRTDFNLRFDVRPRAILFACNAADVVEGIRWARDEGIDLRPRAGGHSYEGYSLVEDGLVIDISPIAHLEVSPDQRQARIGGGIRLADAYERLWAIDQLAIPAGTCGSVGLGGLALGGGFGLLSRQRGLTCDALVEAELVTADGVVVRANESVESDLFWALRGGGGGNFGIVTELVFRVQPVGEMAISLIRWPREQLAEMLDAWQRWAPGIDRRLFSVSLCPDPSQLPRVWSYLEGTPAELQSLIQPLLDVGTPTIAIPPRAVSWIDLVRGSYGPPEYLPTIDGTAAKFKSSSVYMFELLPSDAIATLSENLRRAPGSPPDMNFVQFDNMGGAVGDVSPEATAFVHRRALANLHFYSSWSDDAEEPAHVQWIDAFRKAMLPWASGAYVNYIDANIPDWPDQYYGSNFERLRRVKTDWDPANVFHFPQSIPPLT
jgi:FAD/FMN-containing dehydrogenase